MKLELCRQEARVQSLRVMNCDTPEDTYIKQKEMQNDMDCSGDVTITSFATLNKHVTKSTSENTSSTKFIYCKTCKKVIAIENSSCHINDVRNELPCELIAYNYKKHQQYLVTLHNSTSTQIDVEQNNATGLIEHETCQAAHINQPGDYSSQETNSSNAQGQESPHDSTHLNTVSETDFLANQPATQPATQAATQTEDMLSQDTVSSDSFNQEADQKSSDDIQPTQKPDTNNFSDQSNISQNPSMGIQTSESTATQHSTELFSRRNRRSQRNRIESSTFHIENHDSNQSSVLPSRSQRTQTSELPSTDSTTPSSTSRSVRPHRNGRRRCASINTITHMTQTANSISSTATVVNAITSDPLSSQETQNSTSSQSSMLKQNFGTVPHIENLTARTPLTGHRRLKQVVMNVFLGW